MKHALALGVLITIVASSCAPVASSVPKLATTIPRTTDTVLDDRPRKFDLGTTTKVEILSSDQVALRLKALKADGYFISPGFDQGDREFSDLRENQSLGDIQLAANLKRVEIIAIFAVKKDSPGVSEELESDLNVDWSRNKKNEFSFTILQGGKSGSAWNRLKENLESIVIASREAKPKK